MNDSVQQHIISRFYIKPKRLKGVQTTVLAFIDKSSGGSQEIATQA